MCDDAHTHFKDHHLTTHATTRAHTPLLLLCGTQKADAARSAAAARAAAEDELAAQSSEANSRAIKWGIGGLAAGFLLGDISD
jgi:hypothetical protein